MAIFVVPSMMMMMLQSICGPLSISCPDPDESSGEERGCRRILDISILTLSQSLTMIRGWMCGENQILLVVGTSVWWWSSDYDLFVVLCKYTSGVGGIYLPGGEERVSCQKFEVVQFEAIP